MAKPVKQNTRTSFYTQSGAGTTTSTANAGTPPKIKSSHSSRMRTDQSSPPSIVTTPLTADLSSPEDTWSTSSSGTSSEEKQQDSKYCHYLEADGRSRRNLFPRGPPKLRSRRVLQEIYSWTVDKREQPLNTNNDCSFSSGDEDRQRFSLPTTPNSYTSSPYRHKKVGAFYTTSSFSTSTSSTRWMTFLLCCIGLSSVSMVIVANHKIVPRVERQDHVAVLFRNKNGQHDMPKERRVHLQQLAHTPIRPANRQEKVLAATEVAANGADKEKKKELHTPKQHPHDHHDGAHNDKAHKEKHHHHKHHEKQKEPERPYIRHDPLQGGLLRVVQPSTKLTDHAAPPRDASPTPTDMYRAIGATGTAPQEHRRVVSVAPDTPAPPKHYRTIEVYPAEFTDNTQYYSVLDSSDERVSSTMEVREPLVDDTCVPMQEWQTTFHPSCNGMHEMAMADMGDGQTEDDFRLFGMKGFWRNAWRLDSMGGHSGLEDRDTVVLKTLRINHRFEDSYYENNRIDAVVLERLTASPHVINVFGFCGHSVLTEFADGKRLGELADKKKKEPLARLNIARDIANGLADVHEIDGDGNATFVHFDINPANVVSIGGTLKLNDFNIGVLRRWNTTSNSACGIPTKYPNPQWRSPEEAKGEMNLTEKIDVFSLGHILFRLICSHEPWHKLEPNGLPPKEELNKLVKEGRLPTIPQSVTESTNPEVVAIREAMLQCYTYDPVQRPSAREIAFSLQQALVSLQKKQSSSLRPR